MPAFTMGARERGTQPGRADERGILLENVGVRYRLLTEDLRTIKGRLLNLLARGVPSAEFWALRNVSLSIGPGDILGVVGANGSGKSTLLRVLSSVIAPTEGTCTVKGRLTPLLELGGAFNMELTGRENAYLLGAIFRLSRRQMDELMPEIVRFSELGPFFDVPVKSYSSGMVARLAFSVSAQLDPEILVLDEVLSVGDEHFQKKSLMRMRKLMEKGSIVVIVSHNLDLIGHYCNRAVWLARGTVAAEGEPRAVVAQYRRTSL